VTGAYQGDRNVAIGYNAGPTNANTSSDNVFIGYESGLTSTTSTSVVCVGRNSGNGLTTGTNSIFIGRNAGINTISYTALTGSSSGNLTVASDIYRTNVISIGPYQYMRFPNKTGIADNTVTSFLRVNVGTGQTAALKIFVCAATTNGALDMSSAEVRLLCRNVGGTMTANASSATTNLGGNTMNFTTVLGVSGQVDLQVSIDNTGTPSYDLSILVLNFSLSDVFMIGL
jgi:hypothetical protein